MPWGCPGGLGVPWGLPGGPPDLVSRPQNGSVILYNRKKVKYRKDGYCWKKRKDGKTTREDHMKLKVQGVEVGDGGAPKQSPPPPKKALDAPKKRTPFHITAPGSGMGSWEGVAGNAQGGS